MNPAEWSIHHKTLATYFMIVLMGLGAFSFFSLGQTDLPDSTFKILFIQVDWPGASAKEVELEVLDRLERKLQETPWLDNVKSFARPGQGFVVIELEDGTPNPKKTIPEVFYQVRKKLYDIRDQLPEGVRGPYVNDEFGDVYPLIYAVSGNDYTYPQLKDYADIIRQEFLRLDIVEKVTLVGVQDERVYIEMNSVKLAMLGLTPFVIIETIRAQNAMDRAGSIESAKDIYWLRVSGRFENLDAIRETPIIAPDGNRFRLGDIAKVYYGTIDPPIMKIKFNGHEAVGLAIKMKSGYSILDLERLVAEKAATIQKAMPAGLEIGIAANEAQVAAHTRNLFLEKLGVAIAVVLIVSYFSLGLRSGLIVATAFPLVLGTTFLLMNMMGIDLQRISFGALIISLGLLVDDAIIIIEMILVKMAQGMDRFRAATAAYYTTSFPMLTGTLITVAGFLPMAFAQSSMREFMQAIYMVLGITLIVSWIVSVFFTPLLGYSFLKAPLLGAHEEDEIYNTPFYQRLRASVTFCLKRRYLVLGAFAILIAVTFFMARFVEKQFFPLTDRMDLIVETWLPEGSSFYANEAAVKKLEKIFAREEKIVRVTSYIGGDTLRIFTDLNIEQPVPNLTKTYLLLTGTLEDRQQIRARLIAAIAKEVPEVRARVDYFSFGPPVGPPLQLRVMGYDPEILLDAAEKVRRLMEAHPATEGVHLDWRGPAKSIAIDVDQSRARELGIAPDALARNLETLLSGWPITELRRHDEKVAVIMRLEGDERQKLEDVKKLFIHLPNGNAIPLVQVAHIKLQVEEGVLWRYNRLPTVTVRAYLPWTIQPATVIDEIWPKVQAIQAQLPLGYHIEIGGNVEKNMIMDAAMQATMPLILFIIFTILMIQLQSFGNTFITLATAPLGLIGAIFALYIANRPLGFVAQLGIIAMAGIIMRNTVILIDQIRQDRARGLNLWQSIIESTVRRFRPIVLTAVAAVLALVPLATDAFWGPMAIAMMGGLTIATILTVFFLPSFYALCFRARPEE